LVKLLYFIFQESDFMFIIFELGLSFIVEINFFDFEGLQEMLLCYFMVLSLIVDSFRGLDECFLYLLL